MSNYQAQQNQISLSDRINNIQTKSYTIEELIDELNVLDDDNLTNVEEQCLMAFKGILRRVFINSLNIHVLQLPMPPESYIFMPLPATELKRNLRKVVEDFRRRWTEETQGNWRE